MAVFRMSPVASQAAEPVFLLPPARVGQDVADELDRAERGPLRFGLDPGGGNNRARRKPTAGSGGGIRTRGLRVMSPVSFRAALPRNLAEMMLSIKWRESEYSAPRHCPGGGV